MSSDWFFQKGEKICKKYDELPFLWKKMTTKEEHDEEEEEDQEEEKKIKSETLLIEALRKMAIDRREAVTARCLRRGMFSEYSYYSLKRRQEQQQHVLKRSSSSSSKSYLHLAAKATEMTRTQKRINRNGYWERDLDLDYNESRAPPPLLLVN